MENKRLTANEMFIHLGNGGKVTTPKWPRGHYIHLKDGEIVDEIGMNMKNFAHYSKDQFIVYEGPVKDNSIISISNSDLALFENHDGQILISTKNSNYETHCRENGFQQIVLE